MAIGRAAGRIDPDGAWLGGRFWWLVDEALWVVVASPIEGLLARGVDGIGSATLGPLRDALVAEGLAPATPAAVVERGGTVRQRLLRGMLESITAEAPAG